MLLLFARKKYAPTGSNVKGDKCQLKRVTCTKENMAKMNADMTKMPAGEKKKMAMKEMGMAKQMMAKKDMAGCKSSMDKISGMMK